MLTMVQLEVVRVQFVSCLYIFFFKTEQSDNEVSKGLVALRMVSGLVKMTHM